MHETLVPDAYAVGELWTKPCFELPMQHASVYESVMNLSLDTAATL